jgi:hypothetical protein
MGEGEGCRQDIVITLLLIESAVLKGTALFFDGVFWPVDPGVIPRWFVPGLSDICEAVARAGSADGIRLSPFAMYQQPAHHACQQIRLTRAPELAGFQEMVGHCDQVD